MSAAAAPTTENRRAHVLVADDDEDTCYLLSDILRREGYDVSLAGDGEEALATVWALRPDLVLLDVKMPRLDGFTVCRLLKADPATAGTPILFLTGRSNAGDRVAGLNLGADDYVAKPFDYRELVARVAARVRAKREADRLHEQAQRIRAAFERYVVPGVVERLLADPSRVRLGGAKQVVSVLFADLRGFTALAEQTAPEDLVGLLNGYLDAAARAVLGFEGMLDKFMGDAVMALFNAPAPQPDHARRAVGAAWAVRRRVAELQALLHADAHLHFGIGVHTGEAVVGNIGSADLLNYTAIGDTVNLAGRLESHAGPGDVLISDATYSLVADSVRVEGLGALPFKGRRGPVLAYRVLDCSIGLA